MLFMFLIIKDPWVSFHILPDIFSMMLGGYNATFDIQLAKKPPIFKLFVSITLCYWDIMWDKGNIHSV